MASIPSPRVPLVGPGGKMTPEWYRFFAGEERDVSGGEVVAGAGLSGGGAVSDGVTIDIETGGVTRSMLANAQAYSVIGRYQSTSGAPADIVATDDNRILGRFDGILAFKDVDLIGATVADGDYGDITVSSDGAAWAIDDEAVTNAKLAHMAQATIKGRASGAGTGDATDLTAAQVKTILALVAADISDFSEAVDDRVGSLVTAGTGITATYDDGAGTLTIATTITQYTDELAQDAVGTILTDTDTIDFTYTDATPTITADVKDGSITFAKMQDIATATVLGRSTAGTGDVEALATTGTGNVVLGTSPTVSGATLSGTTNLTGGQIAFPATQSASANANTLDDYEEGTFTPQLLFGGGSTSMTFSSRSGRYTKIGRIVIADLFMILSAKGTSLGNATISGLPFTSAGTPRTVGSVLLGATAGGIGTALAYVSASNTTLDLREFNGTTYAFLTDADFNNNSELYLSFVYTASA